MKIIPQKEGYEEQIWAIPLCLISQTCVDLILADGLYLNAPFANLCHHEVGSDVFKTDDTSLRIIQDAMALFQNADLFSDQIYQVSGVDAERMRQYQVMMTFVSNLVSPFELIPSTPAVVQNWKQRRQASKWKV
jgi:hypothetical protein